MKIKITSDSTIDLSPQLKSKFAIDTVPLEVLLGSDVYEDGVTINPEMIYDYVEKTGVLPKTAARNEEIYAEFFEAKLQSADSVIHYSLSSGISATHDGAKKAAARFGGKVKVLDTLALSTGTALLAVDAVECAEKGMTADEIFARSQARVSSVQTSFIIDKLEFLYKGGRCSKLQVLGANLLKIKPTIEMHGGKLDVAKKFRGKLLYTAAQYVASVLDAYNTPDLTRIFITHTDIEPEIVAAVKKAVAERFEFREVIETMAGATITSHCGKGTIGILYLNDGEKI